MAALAFAHASGAEVLGLHVTPLCPPVDDVPGNAPSQDADRAAQVLDEVRRRAARAGMDTTVRVKRADAPSEAILATARDAHCDLIVMGARERAGVPALRLGSQTETVLVHSTVPVMVVPMSPAT